MSNAKHTPGPYRKHTMISRSHNMYGMIPITQDVDGACPIAYVLDAANADLLAAAPDLLKSLDIAALNLESYGAPKCAAFARAAIAKARGETEHSNAA